ncbi:MAG: IS200/IS605 family transposase [Phycisphaerales bacterium]|jgi:putative transposase|nr:IS200/IS605 family transposase [Phycisphaerales bacterium]
MASTLTKLLVHVAFSTKHRTAIIPDSIEPELYAYIGGICRRMDSPLLAMNGTADHVHLLVSLAKTIALADLMLNIKRDSSKWLKDKDAAMSDFAWQQGYFAFSIGESSREALLTYIANQKQHHQSTDFRDEMRAYFRKYGIEWDELHVWD